MGICYGATMIIGVELGTVYEKSKSFVRKKKFNVDTGKPYFIEESVVERRLFGKLLNYGESIESACESIGLEFIEIDSFLNNEQYENGYVGKRVGDISVDKFSHHLNPSIEQLNEIKTHVDSIILKNKYNEKSSVYMFHTIS